MSIRSLVVNIIDEVIPSRRAKRKRYRHEERLMRQKYVQMEKLNSEKLIPCDASALGEFSSDDLKKIFTNQELAVEWQNVERTLTRLDLPEMTGGVNRGDQRAIYYLVRALCPSSVLEIGTHTGCSLVNIVLAAQKLKSLPEAIETTITTVDILDVNDQEKKPWLEAGAKCSPKELINRIGCENLVTFKIQNSLEFLANVTVEEKFDFIFLDGSHDALDVYREIPAALRRLKQRGFILLHDYFPNLKPLWSKCAPIPGVRLAIQRLENEGVNFIVVPIGKLPWPTKLNSNITSLALLTSRCESGF